MTGKVEAISQSRIIFIAFHGSVYSSFLPAAEPVSIFLTATESNKNLNF